jgi:hypothetical protein
MNIVSVTGSIAGGTSEVSRTPINPLLIANKALDLLDAVDQLNYLSDLAQLDQLVACTETSTPSLMLL